MPGSGIILAAMMENSRVILTTFGCNWGFGLTEHMFCYQVAHDIPIRIEHEVMVNYLVSGMVPFEILECNTSRRRFGKNPSRSMIGSLRERERESIVYCFKLEGIHLLEFLINLAKVESLNPEGIAPSALSTSARLLCFTVCLSLAQRSLPLRGVTETAAVSKLITL